MAAQISEGKHILTGVDYIPTDGSTRVMFCLDGIVYQVKEDDDDGYRSYMSEPEVVEEKIKNTFPEQVVYAKHEEKDGELLILRTESNEILMKVGTDYADSYYPCAIFNWNPELMDINKTIDN